MRFGNSPNNFCITGLFPAILREEQNQDLTPQGGQAKQTMYSFPSEEAMVLAHESPDTRTCPPKKPICIILPDSEILLT